MTTAQDKLSIVTHEVSGQRIVRVAGQIDSVTAPQLEKHLAELLGQGHRFGLDYSKPQPSTFSTGRHTT